MNLHRKALTISIVIPAYNEQSHLVACLDALENQTVPADEIIVVNNNSTDNTANVAKRYKNVTVVMEKKQGIVYARNTGFNAAHGDIIGRIDADSIVPTDWVETIKDFYRDPTYKSWGWTGGVSFYNLPFPLLNGWIVTQIAYRFNRLLLGHYIFNGSNMAIPKKEWNAIKSSTCIREDIHEDLDLAIHLHRHGEDIHYSPGSVVRVLMRRIHRNDHKKLWENLMLWPMTLKVHGMRGWVLSWVGALVLYVFTPLALGIKATAHFLGWQGIE